MLVVMQQGATEQQIDAVIERMVEMGFNVHRSTGVIHTRVGRRGRQGTVRPRSLRGDGGRERGASHRFALQAGKPRLPSRRAPW